MTTLEKHVMRSPSVKNPSKTLANTMGKDNATEGMAAQMDCSAKGTKKQDNNPMSKSNSGGKTSACKKMK
jgi:hypothetical protein